MLHQRLRPRATHQFLIRTSAPNTVPKSSTPKTSPKICIPNFVPKSGAPKTVPKSCTLKSASKITKEMWWCLCTKDLHQRLHPRAWIKKKRTSQWKIQLYSISSKNHYLPMGTMMSCFSLAFCTLKEKRQFYVLSQELSKIAIWCCSIYDRKHKIARENSR